MKKEKKCDICGLRYESVKGSPKALVFYRKGLVIKRKGKMCPDCYGKLSWALRLANVGRV